MALIDDVSAICRRLAKRGWNELLRLHGLDLNAKNLEAELARELTGINRTVPGFEDFCPDGVRAIDPGVPARSLLYHAFASPLVHPATSSGTSPDPTAYPSLEDLDTIENYIYSLTKCKLNDFPGAIVAVFAYQYRTAARTSHGLFADLTFSRTGISRVGTSPQNYDRVRRSFWVAPPDGSPGICVMPARYGAFLAVKDPRHASGVVLDKLPGDKGRDFLFPVHKLFPGKECMGGESTSLQLRFHEFHRNEKLSRIHSHGRIPALEGFDIGKFPFIRDTTNSKDLLSLKSAGSSVLVVPKDNRVLVRTVTQKNTVRNQEEIVRFEVPAHRNDNRFFTSLQIELGKRAGRQAPEYVNIRHRVITARGGRQSISNLNELDESKFNNLIRAGGYEAAHFIDDTCDGYVAIEVKGLPRKLDDKPAYSLVTAPDFFPLADQIEIARWAKRSVVRLQDHFRQGSPEPLSSGRLAANPLLQRLDTNTAAFDRHDQTMTSVVACLKAGPQAVDEPKPSILRDPSTTFLPDAASDVFEPGWDVSAAADDNGQFYAAFGLGSPFPEDAKLCAALNSFWPAVAPDASRTFALVTESPTAIPMLDIELGLHPDHELVRGGKQNSEPGWDGEFGPFFEKVKSNLFVNYASIERSDYVSNSIAGMISVSGLMNVSSDELIDRMEALESCIRKLPVRPHVVSATKLFLVSAGKVNAWETRPDRGDPRMAGSGYLYVFAMLKNDEEQHTNDLRRRRKAVDDVYTCQISVAKGKTLSLCFRRNMEDFQFVLNP